MRTLLGAGLLLVGCAAELPPAVPQDGAAFLEARARLSALRADQSQKTLSIAMELDAPVLPSVLTARGAVAVDPPNALRMVMVGPGGTTAMDLWIAGDRYRFEVPAVGRVLRQTDGSASSRGIPVDFLRFWLLQPFDGELLAARREGEVLLALVRTDGGRRLVEYRFGEALTLRRTRYADAFDFQHPADFVRVEIEHLSAKGPAWQDVTYAQESTGLTVKVHEERRKPGVREAALKDPDQEKKPEEAP